MSLVIAIDFISAVSTINSDMSQMSIYDRQKIREPYIQTIVLVLVAEILHAIVCIRQVRSYLDTIYRYNRLFQGGGVDFLNNVN